MKTKFTIKSRMLAKALFGVALLFCGTSAKAQAPFQGGQTYWVDGLGADVASPKDTFINLNGAYVANAAYSNTTGLMTALNNQGVDPATVGTINIILTTGYTGTETGTINIGQTTNGGYPFMSVQRPVVIKPAPGVNITITSAGAVAANAALVRFNGAQFVTIDGEGTPGERNLSFVMPAASAANTSKVIDIIPFTNTGCQQLTIKNCNIKGLSTAGAAATIGTYAGVYSGGGTTTPSAPLRTTQNISVINNVFEAVQNAVYIRGRETAAGQQDNNLIVRNNICGGTIQPVTGEVLPTTFIGGGTNPAGITLIAQKNAIVEGNTVRNNLPSGGNFRGITLVSTAQNALDTNIIINANRIYNLRSTVASTGVYGIRIGLNSHSQALAISITNNTIAKLSTLTGGTALNTLAYPVGIAIEDASINAGVSIFHNSVHLYGDTLSAGSLSACIFTGTTTNGGIRVANNIFVNRMGRSLSSTGATAAAYIYISNSNARPFSYMRNNAYHVGSRTGSYSFIGFSRKAWPALDNWKVVMPDTGSITCVPPFVGVDDTTLTMPNGSATTLGAYGVGQGITLDINGAPRSSATPSVGAYEFTGNSANAYYPLVAGNIYPINGTSSWPVGVGAAGSFATLADAVSYLNTFGVSGTGNVILQFGVGYTGETTIVPAITQSQGVSATTGILIRPSSGNSYTITSPATSIINNQYALISMIGAKYITIEGQSVTGERNLTFRLDSAITSNTVKVISIASGDSVTTTNITVRNCNIIGAARTSTINTPYGIYQGHYNPTTAFQSSLIGANNNIVLTNNYIQAVRTGIYLRGANIPNGQNRSITINRNIIGGNEKRGSGFPITYVGSVADQAGIYLKGIANATVDSNVVRNADSVTAGSGFRGIDLDLGAENNAVDSFISITRNTIYNLTTTGAYCAGIRVSLGANGNRRISMVNNAISKVRGIGTSSAASAANPAGIIVDGTGTVGDLNMDIYQNTIQMVGTSMSGSNVSYCVYFGASIQGGVRMQGNLLSNKLGRTSALNGNAFAIFSNTTVANSPFRVSTGGFINSNSYGTDALNTNKAVLGVSTTSYTLVNQWQTALGQDFNSYFFIPFFANDSAPQLDPAFAGPLFNGSLTIPSVNSDIAGTSRSGVYTCMGALMFTVDFLPLTGNNTYLINGVNNYPTPSGTPPFSFSTINNAIRYVNSNGVDGITPTAQPIKLIIEAGYNGEGDTMIAALQAYPRMNSSRIITLTNAPGRSDTIRTGVSQAYLANGSIFRFSGGSFFAIDGSNNGTSTDRNITFAFPINTSTNTAANNLKLIDITSGEKVVSNVAIRNCNFIGNITGGTINTFAAVYVGGVAATPSAPVLSGANNINISNNSIGGVRYGIYAQGAVAGLGQQDKGLVVRGNYIGKDTAGLNNQFGGAASAAGIYLNAQANAVVDSNVITNNVTGTTFTANRGIELAATGTLSIDSNVSITRNTIVKIRHIGSAGAAYGVYVNLAADSLARITIANNMISGIASPGTATTGALSTANPFGIFIDATGAVNNLGLNVFYNSINLGTSTTLGTTNNAVSACLGFSPNIRGGVALRNNILQNRLGRTSGTGFAYSIFAGHTANIFTLSDNNCFFADAPNVAVANQGIALFSATAVTPVKFNTYDQWRNFTKQDSMSIVFVTNFVNDTNLALNGFQHLLYGWGVPITTVTNDIQGQSRSTLQTTIGADELPIGVFADSTAPRIYNITKAPALCNNGPFDIFYRVFERPSSVASDTLYYRLNNGPEQFIVGATAVNSFLRRYRIPAQPINTAISYRLAVNDNSPQALRGEYPGNGRYDYTSSTFSLFPVTYGFDGSNPGFTVESQGPGGAGTLAAGGWDLESFGSPLNPVVTPNTGIRAALFPSSTLPSGTLSRIVSPCLDFTDMKVPTLRIWVSQNGEALTNNDRVQVTVTGGFNIWSAPLVTVSRPSAGLAFPQFRQIDVCLANFIGINGLKIGIEAISALGQNIVLDSIVIFDDVLNDAITPLTTTICEYNQLSVNLPSSSSAYSYTLVDAFTGLPLGDAATGTGSAMSVNAPNPSNPFIGRVDSVYAVVKYVNTRSGCSYFLPDTSKIQIKSFYGGPYMNEGVPFNGSFNAGTLETPDGVTYGDTATYELVPPSGLANADYGTKWTVVSTNVKSPVSAFTIVNNTYTAPVGSTNGKYRLIPSLTEVDSLFKVSVTYRLLPSNCDSVVVRYLKVTSAPGASFTTASDSTCPGVPFYMTNTTTFLPYTAPITYLWEFGDGTIATTKDANKTYSYFIAPGMYTVKLTAFNNAGVSSTVTKQIRVLSAPISAFVSGKACGNDSIQFNSQSTGATSFLWTSKLGNTTMASSTLENPKFSFGMSDTLYDVTLRATNDLGCFKDTTIGTFSFSKPTASFSTTNGCLGLNAQFTNNTSIAPGINGRTNTFGSEWDFGNGQKGLSNNPVYKYPASGTYTVTLRATSNYGCVDSAQQSITVYNKPIVGFTTGVACQDQTVAIDNTTTYAGGADKVVYNWNFGDFSAGSTDFEPVKSYASIGSFNILLVATDTVNNCRDTARRTVEVNELPFALFVSGKGCVNSAVTFNNGSIPPNGQTMTYAWDFNGAGSSTATNPSHTFTTPGDKTITMTATTNKGCSDSESQVVKVESVPVVSFTKDSINCNTYKFDPAPDGLAAYKWNYGDGTEQFSTSGENTYQFKGTYTITLTVTSANLCQASYSDSVKIWCTIGFEEEFANKFNLSVYPNPFEQVSNIGYNLDSKKDVTITVMDMLGRVVSEVSEKGQSAGSHTIRLDESKFASTSALYMVRIQIGDEAITKQLMHK